MPPSILAREIRRQMDHCILALAGSADPADARPDVLLSLYWVGLTTECGPEPLAGHLAYVWAAGGRGVTPLARVLTDSTPLALGLAARTTPGRWPLVSAWPAPEPATFQRTAASPLGHTWHVSAADGWTLEARWEQLGEPVFATGLTRDGLSAITTVLVSARRATIAIDGRRLPGRPYTDPIWTPWFGAPQTSCVMGLGEVIHAPIMAAAADDAPGRVAGQ